MISKIFEYLEKRGSAFERPSNKKLCSAAEPFFDFRFLKVICIVFFDKPSVSGKLPVNNRKSKNPAQQRNVAWKVILWPKISKRSYIPVRNYLTCKKTC